MSLNEVLNNQWFVNIACGFIQAIVIALCVVLYKKWKTSPRMRHGVAMFFVYVVGIMSIGVFFLAVRQQRELYAHPLDHLPLVLTYAASTIVFFAFCRPFIERTIKARAKRGS